MSTTTSLEGALKYSSSRKSVLLKLETNNYLDRGADLKYLSAFPGEKEFLYAPLSFLQSDGEPLIIDTEEGEFTVLRVTVRMS